MNRADSHEQWVARRVRERREELGFTQEEMAERLGLSKAGYGHYERGRQLFSVGQLFALSEILGRSVEYFLGLDTGLAEDEDELLTLYRSIDDPRLKEALLGSARMLARSSPK